VLDLQLVVNWRPCAMCYGALLWSGARSLLIAGDGPECEQFTGFDEGPVVADWREQLDKRGITVTEDVLRDEAIDVFKAFGDSTGTVYNARQ
jgi:tRNA(Arg) A34 adenosine deaminase TadA